MKFNEQEVGSLVQRASELHEQSLNSPEHDLSLSEVESIANDLGIPSRFLVEAALEQSINTTKSSTGFWGGPFEVSETRFKDGIVTEEQWQHSLSEMQEFIGKSGQIEQVGPVRRWIHSVGEGGSGFNFEEVRVSLKEHQGKTSIHLKHEFKGAVAMYFVGFAMTSFVTLMVAHSLPEVSKISELIYAGLGGTLALGGVRAAISVSAKRFKDRLVQLADKLHPIVGSSEEATHDSQLSSETSIDAENTPVLDLEHETEIPESEAPGSIRKKVR